MRIILVMLTVLLLQTMGCAAEQEATSDLRPIWVVMADRDGVQDTFMDHPTSTESAEFSPDESLVASVAKGDDSIRLWRADDGSEVWTRRADDETEAVTFTRDGNYVVTGGEDRLVRVMDARDGEVVQTLAHNASIEGLRFSHDGNMLATGNEAGEVNIWNTSDADPAAWPQRPLYTVVHGPDQDHPDGGPEGAHADINQVDWTADDRYIVSASRTGEVKRWDVERMDQEDQGLVTTYRGHTGSIKSVRLSPDGRLVAAGAQQSPDGAARVWEVESGELVAELLHPNMRIMEAVEFSPDGDLLVIGGTEHREQGKGRFYVYEVESLSGDDPQPVHIEEAFNQEYFDFTNDGSKLLVSHADGSLRLWEVGGDLALRK